MVLKWTKGNVTAIQNWPVPTTVKELQRFRGFPNFYRRFIANYSNYSKSLTWDASAMNAFKHLKNAFCTALILVHSDPAWHLNPRQALFFTSFNFKVIYRPGSRNFKALETSRSHVFTYLRLVLHLQNPFSLQPLSSALSNGLWTTKSRKPSETNLVRREVLRGNQTYKLPCGFPS